ncbi:MAG: hypothetical protein HY270_12595 [Deltaproteobacteria bacterium]|nr:hypothetical protein [Deltaproteobacteria bacterium]
MQRALWIVISLSVLLSGCVTVENSKTLTVNPAAAPVTVTSTARVHCYDILLLFTVCHLYMQMESSNGQQVSDFPPQ